MKRYLSYRMAAVVRGGLIGSLISVVGNAVIADPSAVNVESNPDAARPYEPIRSDEEQDVNRPILELDPERSYASEALLSFRSKLSPYGKVLGLRRASEKVFTPVQVWGDVEAFVAQCDDDLVEVKIREPWGTEVVASVTINRVRYPARVRPTNEPPTPPVKPSDPLPNPKPVETKVETKEAPKPAPATSAPVRPELEVKEPNSPIVTSAPSGPSKFAPRPVEPRSAIVDPESPTAPKTPIVAEESVELTPAAPKLGAPVAAPGRRELPGSYREVTPRTIVPRDPFDPAPSSIQALPESNVPLHPSAWLALAPILPLPTGLAEIGESAHGLAYVRVVKKTPKPASKPAPREFEMTDEQTGWLRDAIEVADRMGILSAKPLVTSDRRQNAFALYSLFMALKDFRFEVDLSAKELETALAAAGGHRSSARIEEMSRSVEKGMASIQRWDTVRMESAIRGYAAELQSMGDVRRMISFLAKMKAPAKARTGSQSVTSE